MWNLPSRFGSQSKSTTKQAVENREERPCGTRSPETSELYSEMNVMREMRTRLGGFNTSEDEQLAMKFERDEAIAKASGLEMKLRKAQQENLFLEQKIREQQREITAQKDELFNVRPTEQITDAQVSEKYENLCENIRNWVDKEICAFQDRKGDLSDIQKISTDPYLQDVLKHCPNSLECLVEGQVHVLLQGTIFSHDIIYWGLDPRTSEIIRETAKGLHHRLDPPRDSEAVEYWRSEAIKSIATLTRVEDRRDTTLYSLAKYLIQKARATFPFVRYDPADTARMLDSVITPAAGLEASIRMSSTVYRFSIFKIDASVGSIPPATRSILEQNTCIDSRTRKKIKASHLKPGKPQDDMGLLVYPVNPSLWRETGQPALQLHQNRLLVHLNPPKE